MEGFAVASNAAGLVSLGIQICKELLKYYEAWKEAEDDVRRMFQTVESLTKTLICLRRPLQQPLFGIDAVARVEKSIQMCEEGIANLQRKLVKVKISVQASGWSQRFKSQLHRALYPFKESTIIKLKEICAGLLDNLALALDTLHIDSMAISLQSLDELHSEVAQVSADVEMLSEQMVQASSLIGELRTFQEEQERSKLYDWLSPLAQEFSVKQHDTFNIMARQDQLGLWVLQTEEYQKWASSSGMMLWCIGIRGVGKTVLTSFIIDSLQSTKNINIGLAYLYCDYSENKKQNATNLMRSISQQVLLGSDVSIKDLKDLYEMHLKTRTTPSIGECGQLLQAAVQSLSKIYVVIDALDECKGTTREVLLHELQKLGPKISLLITSRHTFTDHYETKLALRLEIRANEFDIRQYLNERVRQSRRLQAHIKKDKDLHSQILSSIVSRAKGMFLLARLHLDSLAAKTTLRKIKSALDSLPEELDRTYDQVLDRIRSQDPEHAALALRVLAWIHYAARPLKTQELQHALAVEPGDTDFDEDGVPEIDLITSICAGIVTVRENDTMGLVHYTAQEYLERHFGRHFASARTEIAQTCLTYISFDEFAKGPCPDEKSFRQRLEDYPLFWYASQFWGHHVRGDSEQQLKGMILLFFQQETKILSSMQAIQATQPQACDYTQRYTRSITGLWLAATNGLNKITLILLTEGADVESIDSTGQTPLLRAATEGHDNIISLLLEYNANIEAICTEHRRTPLQYASIQGHNVALQLLLDKGASIEASDRRRKRSLHLAAMNAHLKAMELLLRYDANVNATDAYGATALYRVAEIGSEPCAEVLIAKGADINLKNIYDQTALHRAADLGHLGITTLLLQHGADFRVRDYYGFTPRYRALDSGHGEVGKVLSEFEGKESRSLKSSAKEDSSTH